MIFADGVVLGKWDQRCKGYVVYIGGWGWCVGTGNTHKILLGNSLKSIWFTTSRRLIF